MSELNNQPVKAIIFDCFGVLVSSSYELFKKKYLNNNLELLNEFYRIDQLSSRGDIDQSEANREFAKLAGISAEIAKAELLTNPPNRELLDYIKYNLKPNYKIGMLSNVAEYRLDSLFAPTDLELFDDMVLSFQVGLVKPDKKIYELAVKRLNATPQQCIFVDDNQEYCESAGNIGMTSICYDDFPEFVIELSKITGES